MNQDFFAQLGTPLVIDLVLANEEAVASDEIPTMDEDSFPIDPDILGVMALVDSEPLVAAETPGNREDPIAAEIPANGETVNDEFSAIDQDFSYQVGYPLPINSAGVKYQALTGDAIPAIG